MPLLFGWKEVAVFFLKDEKSSSCCSGFVFLEVFPKSLKTQAVAVFPLVAFVIFINRKLLVFTV